MKRSKILKQILGTRSWYVGIRNPMIGPCTLRGVCPWGQFRPIVFAILCSLCIFSKCICIVICVFICICDIVNHCALIHCISVMCIVSGKHICIVSSIAGRPIVLAMMYSGTLGLLHYSLHSLMCTDIPWYIHCASRQNHQNCDWERF